VIYIENPALITQLPFRSKLGKCRIFKIIAAQLSLNNFGKILVTFSSSLKFLVARVSKATLISAKSVQYMTSCPRKLPMNLLESCVSSNSNKDRLVNNKNRLVTTCNKNRPTLHRPAANQEPCFVDENYCVCTTWLRLDASHAGKKSMKIVLLLLRKNRIVDAVLGWVKDRQVKPEVQRSVKRCLFLELVFWNWRT